MPSSLDSTQYTRSSILTYERVYGHNFISPGGLETTRTTVKSLNLKLGTKVLDVGCGIGGAVFYMAQGFGVRVLGVDLSHNMIAIAEERLKDTGLEALISFACGDILEMDFDKTFDVVYSRDAFLHIQDKPRLFHTLHRAMKPGGQLFFTDYCRGEGELSAEFLAYLTERGYDLHTPSAYGQLLEQAGFTDVVALDKSKEFGDILQLELAKMPDDPTLSGVRKSWEAKLAQNQRGEQGWGWFWAMR